MIYLQGNWSYIRAEEEEEIHDIQHLASACSERDLPSGCLLIRTCRGGGGD